MSSRILLLGVVSIALVMGHRSEAVQSNELVTVSFGAPGHESFRYELSNESANTIRLVVVVDGKRRRESKVLTFVGGFQEMTKDLIVGFMTGATNTQKYGQSEVDTRLRRLVFCFSAGDLRHEVVWEGTFTAMRAKIAASTELRRVLNAVSESGVEKGYRIWEEWGPQKDMALPEQPKDAETAKGGGRGGGKMSDVAGSQNSPPAKSDQNNAKAVNPKTGGLLNAAP